MKFCKVSLFFALLVAGCLPVVAQTEVRVNIPFAFVAAGKALPAGQYTVDRIYRDVQVAWRIHNDHDSMVLLTYSVDSARTHQPALIFYQASGVYSLVEFWPEGHNGRSVPKAKVKQTLMAEAGKYVEIEAE